MTGTTFNLEVQPTVPVRLARLEVLANDLLYSWDVQVRDLFRRLDMELWESCGHNPKLFLRRIAQKKLEEAMTDRVFLQDYNRVLSSYDTYLQERHSDEIEHSLNPESDLVAYFCAEFGFHESFPIYSGGLGILAGDHCKAASDLCIPFVAVGLLYKSGYFTQTIDGKGQQIAHAHPADFSDLPIEPARDIEGREIHIHIQMPGRTLEVKVWQAKAGHISLYLLDTDLPVNSDADRCIMNQLYGGDIHTRIQQEIILGVGGVRALRAIGLKPTVWHINEGHAAFQILERWRSRVENGQNVDGALEMIASRTVYTTHTPVPAGHDIFDQGLAYHYFEGFCKEIGISRENFLKMGSFPHDHSGFNMTALALRGSRFHNGVSRIHGGVASQMEGYVWPQIPHKENPIGYVTNGVHLQTFLAQEWMNLFDLSFGGGWRNELRNNEYWESHIDQIPDYSFWSVRQTLKAKMLAEVYQRAVRQFRRNGFGEALIGRLTRFLAPEEKDVLVIGFARRFATYKRATLLFSDPERLARLLGDETRPVVFIFAGKAHPSDIPGQELMRVIHDFSLRPEFQGKILMLEGYDLSLGRCLVAGVDVWLNNPEYPLEASGTSGMKVALNGGINLSVLDGWWAEAYDGGNGWAIEPYDPGSDIMYRNHQESGELLDLLERQVLPLYYSRQSRRASDVHGYSMEWVKRAKASMKTLIPRFNAQRMVMDYVKKYYGAANSLGLALEADGCKLANELAAWKKRVLGCWDQVSIRHVGSSQQSIVSGEKLTIEVAAKLGQLDADDVVVECLIGTTDGDGKFFVKNQKKFQAMGENSDGEVMFKLEFEPPLAGLQQYKLRIYPRHSCQGHPFELGCMLWV